MVDWHSPSEVAIDAHVYGYFTMTLVGVAVWDVLSTMRFDWSILSGQRQWKWPMALYFICRIAMILHIVAIAVNLNALREIPCQEVVWISKVTDAVGTCCSSLIFVLRTRAVWNRDLRVSVCLFLLFLGQIVLWVQTFRFSLSRWDPQRNVCAVISTAPRPLLVAVFSYTMAFDFIVLLLCAIKLHLSRISSTIGTILLRDGITIFAALTLNPVMNIIALPFALVVSVIAATTIFRHVFLLYDSFSHVSVGSGVGRQTFPGHNSTDHRDRVGGINNRLPLTQAFSNPTRIPGRRSSDLTGFHMGPLKSSDLGEVTVHKVVEISVDHSNAPSAAPTVDVESMESDCHRKNEF